MLLKKYNFLRSPEVLTVNSITPKNPQQPASKKKKNKQRNNLKCAQETTQNQPNHGWGTNKKYLKVKFPCNICQGDHLTNEFPCMDDFHHLLVPLSTTQQLVFFNSYVPSLAITINVVQAPSPPPRGNDRQHFFPPRSNVFVVMCNEKANLCM